MTVNVSRAFSHNHEMQSLAVAFLALGSLAHAHGVESTPVLTLLQQNTAHYGNPATGCMLDELAIRISGAPGGVCAASCRTKACPKDIPEGCEASPRCALENASTGDKFCALLCGSSTNCGPGASCQLLQGDVGVCTYDVNQQQQRLRKPKSHDRKKKFHDDADSSDGEDSSDDDDDE